VGLACLLNSGGRSILYGSSGCSQHLRGDLSDVGSWRVGCSGGLGFLSAVYSGVVLGTALFVGLALFLFALFAFLPSFHFWFKLGSLFFLFSLFGSFFLLFVFFITFLFQIFILRSLCFFLG